MPIKIFEVTTKRLEMVHNMSQIVKEKKGRRTHPYKTTKKKIHRKVKRNKKLKTRGKNEPK